MLRIGFTPADLAGLRFAHSPMAEVVTSTRTLRRPGPAMFDALFAPPTGHTPDFLTPVPPVARPSLPDELRRIAATPLDRVAAEVAAAWAGHPAPAVVTRFGTDPAGGLAVLLTEIRQYFGTVVAPHWPRLRTVVDAEIARRALDATERGPRALVAGLHPRLDWDGAALRMDVPDKHREWTLDGHQLTLLPTGFAGFDVYFMTEAPEGRALWYAPRGHGTVLDGATGPASPAGGALAALLGPTRAAVLTLLAAPHSTGEVAAALRLAPATASHHLTTLRDAGLVAGNRDGRRLRYLRTALGGRLVG